MGDEQWEMLLSKSPKPCGTRFIGWKSGSRAVRTKSLRQTDPSSAGNWTTGFRLKKELVWKPAVELKEKDTHFELQAALAGMDPKEIRIEVTPEELLIRSDTKFEKREEKEELCYTEFQSGFLFRSIRFPKRVDPNRVRAEYRNGLLSVTAPIAEEARARGAA
jgi:HSP20 family protein